MIAISILAPYVVVTKKIVEEIRKFSKSSIIGGGKYPTVSPDRALEFLDFACKGEGELILIEIFNAFNFKDIQGLWYKDENGKVVNRGQKMLIENLDEIPFPAVGLSKMYFIENNNLFEDDPEVEDSLVWIMSSRGCFYQCSYCINSLLIPMNKGNGNFLRQRSPDNVIEEIEARLKKHKCPEGVYFVDELFGTSIEWTMSFCEKYKKRVGLPFFCELNPNLIRESNIQILADAGLRELDFGIQSGSDKIRNRVMNRPGTNRKILEKADILRKYNVKPRYDLILKNPFDTIGVLEETIDLLLELPKPLHFNIYKMQFFPLYPFTLKALKEGFISEEDLTDEKVAESVLKNWAFIPKIFSLNRKDYLENCIFLLAWNSMFGEILSLYLRKKENQFFGFIANILARIKYYSKIGAPLWLRKLFSGFYLLGSGNLKLLASKIFFMIRRKY